MTAPQAVVVGGGLAGMSCALRLADVGVPVTLLEARPRFGGATYSMSRGGLRVDNGQHVFLRCCTEYRDWLDRLGVTDRVRLQPRLSVPVLRPDGRRGWLRRSDRRPPLHLLGALAGYRLLPVGDRWRAARAALALAQVSETDPATDALSFGDWLQDHRQSPAAVAALWELIALPTLNVPVQEASLAGAAMVFKTGLLLDATGADIGYARVPLTDLHAQPALTALRAAGGQAWSRQPVRRISRADGRWLVHTDTVELAADVVVVAVPHDDCAALLPAGAVADPDRFRALGTSPIVNVHIVYDRQVTELPFAAAVDSPVQWVFDRTETAGLAGGGQYLAVSLSAADEQVGRPTAELVASCRAGLTALFPAAGRAEVRDAFVTRERAATFRWSAGVGGLRPAAGTDAAGLFLAGAWTATGWPATMEGAVRSGHTAAALASDYLGAATRSGAAA